MLNLIRVLKQQFIECNFVECKFIEHINGNKRTKYEKQDILFLR